MSEIYNRINQLCKENKTNITEMCRELNMSRSPLSELKAGRSKSIAPDKIIKIAQYFGVPTDYILGITDDPTDYQKADDVPNELYKIEQKLKYIGFKIGFYEEDAYLWIEFPDGTLEVTEQDLLELNKSTDEFLKFKLMELKNNRIKDFKTQK